MNNERGNRYKRLSIPLTAASLVTAIALLTACGEKEIATDKTAQQQPVKKDNVELVFASDSGWTVEAFNERFGDTMRKKFPDYKIKYIPTGTGTSLPELVASGQQIDNFWGAASTTIGRLKEFKLELDMNELIKKHGVNVSAIEKATMDSVRTLSDENKLYALPLISNTGALYYNKSLFDKFGVSYPQDGMNWDQVLEVAKKLKRVDGGTTYYGIGYVYANHMISSSIAIPHVDQKTNKATIVSDERWKIVFDKIFQMRETADKKKIYTNEFLKEQNTGMLDALANLFQNTDMSAINWDMVTYPVYKESANKGPQPIPTLFGITSTSKFKDEAMEVLKHMLTEEVQLAYSERAIIPVVMNDKIINAFGTKSNFPGKNLKSIIKNGFSAMSWNSPLESKISPIYSRATDDYVDGKGDLNTIMRNAETEINKLLSEETKK